MKSRILIIIFYVFLNNYVFAKNLNIESENILLDKKKQVTIFQNNVVIKTLDNNLIKSDYAEYDKKNKIILLKNNVIAQDSEGNLIKTEYAEFDEENEIFISKGLTKITTSQNFKIIGENINFDNKNKVIKSSNSAVLTDIDKNTITLSNFEYKNDIGIFKSIGKIKINDKFQNSYEFSQIYIDTKTREVVGTDIKAFINNQEFKLDEDNKPRIFANTISMKNENLEFKKAIFTNCNYRQNDKCPPWTIKSSKILHDNKKKTIYYDNAVIKIYDVPVFYLPKFSHPDPSVKRRSGFLNPSFANSTNLGRSIKLPYFFAIDKDKDFTLNTRIFTTENPLYLGEYRQAFEASKAIIDLGFTEGFKKTSGVKKEGDKSHIFTKFFHNFKGRNDSNNALEFTLQEVSDDKYFKLYSVNTDQVSEDITTLENSIVFNHKKDDLYLNVSAGIYETLKSSYNDKFEYIYPEIELRKNLVENSLLGNVDLDTNIKVLTQDTNKTSKFFINNFLWDFKDFNFNSGIKGKLLSKIKNINYETKNILNYKESTTHELFGAFGYFTEVDLIKETSYTTKHYLKPKALFKYSPGQMRKETDGDRLDLSEVFSLDRSGEDGNFENGLSVGVGFDYEIDTSTKNFKLSMGQVINQKENKKMSSISSLDEKLSDLVGKSALQINESFQLNYNFLVDQNYSELNYNEIGAKLDFELFSFKLDYLQERKHIGKADFATAQFGFKTNNNSSINFKTKRNLITNSSEYYDLSYQYFNDCLRAGIAYRREFYQDSEVEPENSLMFRISILPDGDDKQRLLD